MKKIIIRIDEWGNAKVEAQGFAGSECLDATRLVEIGLGQQEKDDPTPEMYLSPDVNQET